MLRNWVLAAAGLGIASVMLSGPPAEARLRCSGAYLVTRSGEVRTPYCEDEYLAAVARSYGDHVTGDQIRASFSLKGNICRLVGNDIRVDDICNQFKRQSDHRCMFLPC